MTARLNNLRRTKRPASASRRGFTLIELLVSLAITAILMGAAVSSVLLAGKAVPNANDAATSSISSARIADQICGELETAQLVVEQSSTALTIIVPARGSHTWPERIRYSWAGTAGAPLLRQYDGGTAVAVIDHVYQFSLTPVIATSTESYPGTSTEDSAETLLFDYSGTTGLQNQNVTTTSWVGQYFSTTSWPSGVIGWRPTHARFQAMQSALVATTNVVIGSANSGLGPSGTVYQTQTLLGSALLTSFAWQDFYFTTTPRLATSAAVCLALEGVTGTPNTITVEKNTGSSMLKTTNSGSTWQLDGSHSLQSQLYGKLTRSAGTQTATSRYLTALGISLRAGASTNPAVQATALCLNHPELLSAFWELKFDKDPTQVDANGDAQADWAVHGGGTFSAGSLVNATWHAGGAGLDSQPGDNFSRLTIVDVRFRATSSGSSAGFSINAARSGSTCAPVLAQIAMQSDGTQTLTVSRKTSDAVTDTLLTIPGLSGQPVDLHLVIDPAYGSVAISVNTIQYGAFAYASFASADASQAASLTSSGSAEFGYVRVREFQP